MLRMRGAVYAFVCLLLAACGGGGGGGDDGGGGSNPPGSSGTPDSLYKGQRQQAEITESNHAVIADSAWYGPMTFFLLAQDVITEELPDESIDESVSGSEGGTARIRGRIRSGTGTLTVDYSNFKEEGATLNGRETVEILTRRTSERGSVRRTFTDLSYRDADIDVIMNGSLTRTDSTTNAYIGAHWEISGDLLLSEQTSSNQRLLASVALTRDYVSVSAFQSYPILTGTARVYDNVLGYVDVSFESPVRFVNALVEQDVAPGGSLAASGASNSKMWVSPLSADYVAVELGTQNIAKPDRSLLYRWSEAFDLPVKGAEITAIVGSDIEISDNVFGSPVTLEGRFSHSSVSGAFTRPEWTLLLTPPGSRAEIVDVTSTRPHFTADVDGTYMFQLKVSDGTSASSLDYLRLDANSSVQQPDLTNERARLITQSRIAAPAGGDAVLDASRSFTTTGRPLRGVSWRVHDTRSLNSDDFHDAVATVSATAGQDFLAVLTGNWVDFPGRPKEVWLSTPGNVWFSPTVNLGVSAGSLPQLVDIDGNGTRDIVRSAFGDQPAAPMVTSFILNLGAGRFERLQQTLNGGASAFSSSPVVFVDVNGDTRLDAVVAEFDGMSVSIQTSQSPLSFGPLVRLPRNLSCGVGMSASPRSWVVIDVNGDGRKDIISEPACTASALPLELYINDGSATSGFQQATALPGLTNDDLVKLTTGDIDGDGVDDLLGVQPSSATEFRAFRNRSNGQFDLFSAIDAPDGRFFTARLPISVALVDGDNVPDLVLVASDSVAVALGKGAGVFEYLPLLTPPLASSAGFGSWVDRPVIVIDMDRDGLKDIVTATWWARQIRNGQFASPRPFTSTIGPAMVGDINGDGRLDLVSEDGPSIALGVP